MVNYDTYRAQFWDKYNPFINIDNEYIIDQNTHGVVLANRGPYTDDHLLIIPKREVHFLKDLTTVEKQKLMELLEKRLQKLEQKYEGVNVLLRDGYFRKNGGKSVNHLHWHLIPEIHITSYASDSREFFSEEEYLTFIQKIKNTYGE